MSCKKRFLVTNVKSEVGSQKSELDIEKWELGTGNWEWDRSWKDIISQGLLEMLNKSILKLSWHINYGNSSLVTFKHFFSFSRVHQYELPVQQIIISSFQLMAINWVALFSSVSFVMVEALFNNKSSHVLLLHDTGTPKNFDGGDIRSSGNVRNVSQYQS